MVWTIRSSVLWLIFFSLPARSEKDYSERIFSGCPYGDTNTRISGLMAALLIHAFFNLNRVCKTGTPMRLLLIYLIPEAASSFYTLLHIGKDANVISIDLTLVRRK